MNIPVTPVRRTYPTITPALRHTRLADMDPSTAVAARDAGRVTDLPDRRSDQQVRFNSAV
ncbi:hypothetical protein ABZ372_13930 [Streptomyces sp. NPDC005921]|uniref:hypothetical protein n=1 Tax=Streptomyces sp. NPDC005827 TaxID=3157070 RepID=UPI0033F8AE2E